jgi:cysteine desulfurase
VLLVVGRISCGRSSVRTHRDRIRPMTAKQVYLDHAASTPVAPRVLEAMLPYFSQEYGNPSSIHRWGQKAETAVDNARSEIADALKCTPEEVVFTGCGSESDNLALRGAARAAARRRHAHHILTTPVEHHAVLRTAEQLAEDGFELEFLPVDEYGQVSVEDLERRLRPETAVVSIIFANNEIGTINPISELAAVCHAKGIPFHTDAVQAASQLELDLSAMSVDLLSIGAHKFYGPKGVGALFVRKGTPLDPSQTGGSQEFGLRAGTHNVPLIVGMARALQLTAETLQEHAQQYRSLRDDLIRTITQDIPETRLTGHPEQRLPNHASFVFRGVDGNQLLAALDLLGFGCSSGSACKTGDPAPSDVLTAIGQPREWALGSLRVTVGRTTTRGDIQAFVEVLPGVVGRMRRVAVL